MPVKQEQVNVNVQTVLALVPIVDFWAAYRIEKFRFWCLFNLGMILMAVSIEMVLPYPYNTIIDIAISIPLSMYLLRMWSKEWNAKVASSINP